METKINIELTSEHKIWFTSDLHFGHKNVIKFCHRPFVDVKEMNSKLIENWNEVVSNEDLVFVLGDFSWWDSNTEIQKILKQLKGKTIYLIPGNHDSKKGFRELPERVQLMNSIVQVWIQKNGEPFVELALSHYPLMTWSHREKEWCYNFFGHIHSKEGEIIEGEARMDQDLPLCPRKQYDVGVDNNNYRPIELHEILKKFNF